MNIIKQLTGKKCKIWVGGKCIVDFSIKRKPYLCAIAYQFSRN